MEPYMDPNPEGYSAKEWLKKQGLNPMFLTGVKPVVAVCLVILVAMVPVLFIFDAVKLEVEQILAAIIALVTVAVGYIEWVLTKYESSIDKFYQRLEASNKSLGTSLAARSLIFDATQLSRFDPIMYTYGELDTLDYVVQKYRNGFMDPEQAYRGVMTFYARLINSPFRICTSLCLANPGYCKRVRWLVRGLIRFVDEEQKTPPLCPSFNAFCLRHAKFCQSAQAFADVMFQPSPSAVEDKDETSVQLRHSC